MLGEALKVLCGISSVSPISPRKGIARVQDASLKAGNATDNTNNEQGDSIMNGKKIVSTLVFAATFAAGYTAFSDEKADKLQGETAAAASSAENAKEAAQEAKDYAFEQKAEFVAAMKDELAEINAQIDKLIADQVSKVGEAVKVEAMTKLQALRAQALVLGKQLDEANNTTKTNWDDFKSGFKKSYSGLKASVKESRQWLSEKIAP